MPARPDLDPAVLASLLRTDRRFPHPVHCTIPDHPYETREDLIDPAYSTTITDQDWDY